MKKYVALFAALMFLTSIGCAQNQAEQKDDKLNWYINLEEAVEVAQEENKNILVNFTGSDWCVWCMRLSDEVFIQDEFGTYANENLVLVKIDFPRKKQLPQGEQEYNNGLAQKYGIRGFPTILLLDSDGNLVRQTQYQPGGAENYIKHIDESYIKS
jgi:protein disulfide-isomerase